jgi:hypothetical protein
VKTEHSTMPNAVKTARLAPPPPVKKRVKRRKAHIAWEQAVTASDGLRARRLGCNRYKIPHAVADAASSLRISKRN